MDETYSALLEEMNKLWIIDTHEHLEQNEEDLSKDTDFLKEYLRQYMNSDLITAGLSQKDFAFVIDHSKPLEERWLVAEPYWNLVRKTGYGRALDIAARDLYGIPQINADTVPGLNEKYQKSIQSGHFDYVLKQKSKILTSLVDVNLDCDRTYFRSVLRLDHYVYPTSMELFDRLEDSLGISICSFDDWLDCCEKELELAREKGIVALKMGLAYQRSLHYDFALKTEAEEEFNRLLRERHLPTWVEKPVTTSKAFQDYMMHYILRLANRRGMTVQVHTGIQEGNGNLLSNSDPSQLCNLFWTYRDITFDVFHIGYPYQGLVTAMVKNFPHVYVDMCWVHIVSPVAAVNTLAEWIECLPLNKISAFGGDYGFVDGVYGHQFIARENVSKALYRKIKEQVLDLDEAKEIARMLFYRNPKQLFHLDDLSAP